MFTVLVKALIVKDNRVLLIRRSEHSTFGGGGWDIPGGKLEFGELPEEGVTRETYEETSLKIKIVDVLEVNSAINSNEERQYITIVYLAEYIDGLIQLNDEHSEYIWIDIDKNSELKKLYYVEDSIKKLDKNTSTK